MNQQDVHVIRFEEFVTEDVHKSLGACNRLALYLGVQNVDALAAVQEVGGNTMTYTGKVTSLDDFWTDEMEEWFVEQGGVELNQMLGYTE